MSAISANLPNLKAVKVECHRWEVVMMGTGAAEVVLIEEEIEVGSVVVIEGALEEAEVETGEDTDLEKWTQEVTRDMTGERGLTDKKL